MSLAGFYSYVNAHINKLCVIFQMEKYISWLWARTSPRNAYSKAVRYISIAGNKVCVGLVGGVVFSCIGRVVNGVFCLISVYLFFIVFLRRDTRLIDGEYLGSVLSALQSLLYVLDVYICMYCVFLVPVFSHVLLPLLRVLMLIPLRRCLSSLFCHQSNSKHFFCGLGPVQFFAGFLPQVFVLRRY